MATQLTIPEQIRQLDDARKLVLGDVSYYPSVVRGVLPVITPTAHVELRRWGVEFLSEAFATPALANSEKETMQPYVLATLEAIIQNEKEDPQVLRSVIQTVASIYPLAMRWIINNGYDTVTYEKIMGIKQNVLRIWESAVPSVRICCIKFVQRVILAQTVASGAEHRHGGALDVSLDKIPPNHQTLDPRNLEAEASGLLDRMLSVLQDSTDALTVDATLNCLSILVRTRPGTSNRILNALLNFNPLKLANSPMTPKTKVMVKSMEKTSRLLLMHLCKRDPHNPMVSRIQQHVERMMRTMAEVLEGGRKRPLEAQPVEAEAKRQKMVSPEQSIPPLGSGPHTLADVFTLIPNDGLKNFDVSQVPSPMVAKIAASTLARADDRLLQRAIGAVRDRLNTLGAASNQEINPNTAPLGVDDDDDDYEPDFSQAEDTEQILNKLDSAAPVGDRLAIDDALGLSSFSLPEPQKLTPELALTAGGGSVSRVVEMMRSLDDPSAKRTSKSGFRRLAASSTNRDSWMTIITRLATRSSAGLDEISVKGEEESAVTRSLSTNIRDVLYNYVMEDFRRNIDVAVSWLCEEWYNDKMLKKSGRDCPLHYEECALRLIDGFLPYLHPQDKVLTRFLSEIPELNCEILSRVKSMCRDPSVVPLALTSLLYLVMMRPPIKEAALDTVENIWTEYEDARTMAGKYLKKFRPQFIEANSEAKDGEGQGGSTAETGVPVAAAAT